MKIDLHCHTIATKKGDAYTRNVNAKVFTDALDNNQVSIAAITNHNVFDMEQFEEFTSTCSSKGIMLWPGIELDVQGHNSKGHVIIIADNREVESFNKEMKLLLGNTSPDNFCIEIEDLVNNINNLNVIVIAHYGRKKPCLCDTDMDCLKELLNEKTPFFLEVPNLRSAGILYAHNLNSFIGSDVQNWSRYSDCELPELKMPIKDFSHFCLLTKKDPKILKTFLDEKKYEEIKITPFIDCELTLPIYNDINVVFGGKGTGKSFILKSIKDYFDSLGNSDVVYYDGQIKESEFDKLVKITNKDSDFDRLEIRDCVENFNYLKNWKETTITPLKRYCDWEKTKNSSTLSDIFGFKNSVFNELISNDLFESRVNDLKNARLAISSFGKINDINLYLQPNEVKQLDNIAEKLIENIKIEAINQWIIVESLKLEKFTIDKMKVLCQSKSGVSQLPSSTGLLTLYGNCKELQNNVSKICHEMKKPVQKVKVKIGNLQDKGVIYVEKLIYINPNETNVIIKNTASYKLTDLRGVYKAMLDLEVLTHTSKRGEKIAELVDDLNTKQINSLRDFVCVKGKTINSAGEEYKPSNGEKSMLLLANSLVDDTKNIYVLDEPELSVGHKYINDIIVPRLIELAKLDKKVILSTHDANIAVRTLPLLSIYREYNGDTYKTYVGNAFIDKLENSLDNSDVYSWTEKSLSTLEGGEYAFIERGEIYGK